MQKIFPLRGFQLLLIILIAGFGGYYLGTHNVSLSWKNFKPITTVTSKAPPATQNLDLSLLYNIVDRINQDYYDKTKLDAKKLLYGAINGMLATLDDPYTSFFPPKQNTDFKTQLAGQFEGIGAELGMSSDNKIMVVSPLDNNPAQKAGVRSGDLVLKVNGESTTGWTVAQAVDKIRGPRGTKVTLTVQHEKEKNSTDITIERNVIVVKSVKAWVKKVECKDSSCLENQNGKSSVAYIRLSQFGDKTNDEWVEAINSVTKDIKNENNFKGVILDLRNNPGGYLNDAVFIASEFLKSGVVVMQEDGSGQRTSLSVSRPGSLTDYPLIVLINKGSASASEIVAGALHDYNRAKLLGEKSFGKGTIQQAVDVDSGASVHISVAKWLTPNGTWVHKQGIEPDIKVDLDQKSLQNKDNFDNQLQRAIQELTNK